MRILQHRARQRDRASRSQAAKLRLVVETAREVWGARLTGEARHGDHRRRHRQLAYADHRLRLRQEEAGRSGVGADLRGVTSRSRHGSRRRSRTCCSSSTTTTSRRSSSTTTRRSRWASATSYAVADEGGGARALPPVPGHPALPQHIGACARGRRVRHVVLPGPRARPRLFFAAVDDAAARARVAGGDRAAAGRRAAVPDSDGAPLLRSSARRCAARSRAIPRTSRSRSSPPAACRTRSTASAPASTTPRGTTSSWICSRRDPEQLREMTHARIRDARRLRRRRGHHVADHARRDGGDASSCLHRTYYLPSMTGIATAIYENDGGAATVRRERAQQRGTDRRATGRRRDSLAGTYPFTLARSVQGLPPEQVPASDDRARASRALPRRSRGRVRGRGADRR